MSDTTWESEHMPPTTNTTADERTSDRPRTHEQQLRERIAQAIETACHHRLGDGTCYRCTHAAHIARGEGRR